MTKKSSSCRIFLKSSFKSESTTDSLISSLFSQFYISIMEFYSTTENPLGAVWGKLYWLVLQCVKQEKSHKTAPLYIPEWPEICSRPQNRLREPVYQSGWSVTHLSHVFMSEAFFIYFLFWGFFFSQENHCSDSWFVSHITVGLSAGRVPLW